MKRMGFAIPLAVCTWTYSTAAFSQYAMHWTTRATLTGVGNFS